MALAQNQLPGRGRYLVRARLVGGETAATMIADGADAGLSRAALAEDPAGWVEGLEFAAPGLGAEAGVLTGSPAGGMESLAELLLHRSGMSSSTGAAASLALEFVQRKK